MLRWVVSGSASKSSKDGRMMAMEVEEVHPTMIECGTCMNMCKAVPHTLTTLGAIWLHMVMIKMAGSHACWSVRWSAIEVLTGLKKAWKKALRSHRIARVNA